MRIDYNKQAIDFLQATGTTMEIVEAVPQTIPLWELKTGLNANQHIKYSVTLKNKNHSYTFDFWGSIADYQKVEQYKERNNIHGLLKEEIAKVFKRPFNMMTNDQIKRTLLDIVKPSEYDILACLSPMYEDTFEDFCAYFGYDTDSRTAEDTYKRCIEQDRHLHKLFTHEQLDQLAEIN